MKQSDIDRLKEKLGDEFELVTQSPDENDKFFVVIAKKENPWEGVEFAESTWSGNILPVNQIDDFENSHIIYFKPSTEAAYVSQLKEKAKELYGEIKEGEEFERNWLEGKMDIQREIGFFKNQNLSFQNLSFEYIKETDTFIFAGVIIYQKGKWAKKIERVRVEWVDWSFTSTTDNKDIIQQFKLKNIDWYKVKNKDDIGEYLAKCLEDKLNEK
jgi:hypothetical protein